LSNPKSVLKTFRLDLGLASKLSKTARRLGMSENEYVIKRISKSLMIEPLVQNIRCIRVSGVLFEEVFSLIDSSSFETISAKIVRDNIPLAFELLDLDTTP